VEFSPWHIAIVVVLGFLLFFGWKQLPDMARSAGRSLRVFRTELKGMAGDDAARDAAQTSSPAAAAPAPPAVAPGPVTPPAAPAEDVSVPDGPGTAAG
jgi:sec-independent protein translocase protein TatA